LQVEETKNGDQVIYRIIWPDDSRTFLYLDENLKPPDLPGESQREAKKIGKLVESKLN